MIKRCFKCGQYKDEDEFYKHPAMASGRLGKCNVCARTDVRENYKVRREQYSEYEHDRNRKPKRKADKRRYGKEHAARNPQKAYARRCVGNAVRDGRLVKLPCENCGEQNSQAHHDDYSKPLDVRWLCFKCHREIGHGQTVVAAARNGSGK